MAKRKPSFEIEEVLPDDDRLNQRGKLWKSFMDTITVGSAVIERQFRLWYLAVVHSALAFRRWLVLRGRKRKLDPPPLDVNAPPDETSSGEPPPKYAKSAEQSEVRFDDVLNVLEDDPTDESNVNDVESDVSGDEEEYSLGPREEFDKKLEQVVAARKSNWAKTGLLKLMESIEDPGQNMLSHEKVEKWLFNQHCPFDMTQANETVMTQQDANGGRREYHRKQQVTVSRGAVDDTDSLYSVDTAKYILQNTKERNTTSKIKIRTTMIKQYTISTNNTNALAIRPSLHSISSFPIEEEPSTSRLLKTSKSDSAFETGEDQSQNRSNERSIASQPSKLVQSPIEAQPEKHSKRKKVFKKTMKKKSPSCKGSKASTQQYEDALKSCLNVKKVKHPKSRRIHWLETSNVNDKSSSSEDESDNVFTRNTRSKTKVSPKRVLRTKVDSQSRSSVTPEKSPRKKIAFSSKPVDSPRKNVDRELLQPFEAFCLSPTKRISKPKASQKENKISAEMDISQSPTKANPKPSAVPQHVNKTIDQTANMTALFSAGNDKITNSTEIINSTVSSNRSMKSGTYWNRNACGYRDESRGIVVYKPQQIRPTRDANASVRITYADLTLDGVHKPRHLEKFKKFNYLIHPNSTVRFFPSDSEEEGPERSLGATTVPPSDGDDDADESFDDDDPILTFNPRETGRLNVIEYPYKGT